MTKIENIQAALRDPASTHGCFAIATTVTRPRIGFWACQNP